jgi:AmiR/NasT family two-component response regulator
MERHAISEEGAFEMLRTDARSTRSLLVDEAQAIVDGARETAQSV